MSEPEFLTLGEVLGIHADQIRVYGGASGLRDLALLRSAIAMPETSFDVEYLHPGVFEMAAAYLFHLARNHPFVDGDERTALMRTRVPRLERPAAARRSAQVVLVGRWACRGRGRQVGGLRLPQATLLGSMSREWDLERQTESGRSIRWGAGRTMRATRSHLE